MNIEIKEKLAKQVIETMEFFIKSPISELQVKENLRDKLKKFQMDKINSPLLGNVDAMFEVFSRFPYKGVSVRDFCAGVVYKSKLTDANHHFVEIKTMGEARLIELYEEIEKIQKQLDEECKEMYNDSEYLELLEARKCLKTSSNAKNMIDHEIYKKEKNYIGLYNKKKEYLNMLTQVCIGKKYEKLDKDELKEFFRAVSRKVLMIREQNSNPNM